MSKQTHQGQPPKSSSGPVTSVQSNVVKRLQAARARIEPRMLAVARHFTDFVTLAKGLKSHVPWDYNVERFGALHTTDARDFSIDIDDREKPQKITVFFRRYGPADLSALPTSSQAYAELMDCLPGYGLKFTGSTAGNISKIAVKPVVPVEFRVLADIPGAAIRVILRNVEDLGVINYAFNPEDVGDKFMAAVDALLLHRPGDFYRFAGKAISESKSAAP
jgi:hypothetical protein